MIKTNDIAVSIKLNLMAATIEKSRPRYYKQYKNALLNDLRGLKADRRVAANKGNKALINKLSEKINAIETTLSELFPR